MDAMTEPGNDLLTVVQLGVEAEQFKVSQLGRYLSQCADEEIENARDQLCEDDPVNTDLITKLQNKVFRASQVLCWIDEAVESGQHAASLLQQREEEG